MLAPVYLKKEKSTRIYRLWEKLKYYAEAMEYSSVEYQHDVNLAQSLKTADLEQRLQVLEKLLVE